MFCRYCGNEILEDAKECNKCGAKAEPLEATYNVPVVIDTPSIGLNVLSLLFPIVGLILYLVYKDTTPKRARSIGMFALIGVAIGFVYTVIALISVPTLYYML